MQRYGYCHLLRPGGLGYWSRDKLWLVLGTPILQHEFSGDRRRQPVERERDPDNWQDRAGHIHANGRTDCPLAITFHGCTTDCQRMPKLVHAHKYGTQRHTSTRIDTHTHVVTCAKNSLERAHDLSVSACVRSCRRVPIAAAPAGRTTQSQCRR